MSTAIQQEAVSPLVASWTRVTKLLSQDFLGGPRVLKFAWVINAQKGATLFFVGALMLAYRNFSTAAWVYLALHGTYGLCWLLKHAAFPDPSWERRITFGGAFLSVAMVLGPVLALLTMVGLPRPAQVGIGLATVAFIVVLTGAEPSVMRAGAMSALTLSGLLLGRARSTAPARAPPGRSGHRTIVERPASAFRHLDMSVVPVHQRAGEQ